MAAECGEVWLLVSLTVPFVQNAQLIYVLEMYKVMRLQSAKE